MKNFVLYFILLASFLSCKKDDDTNNNSWGTVSALRNGESWTGEISAVINTFPSDTGIIINIHSIDKVKFGNDYLVFFKVPPIIDKYPLSLTPLIVKDSLIGSDYSTLVSDGHVLGDHYYVLEGDSVEDYIEITEIKGDEIKGKFQASYLRDTPVDPNRPPTPDTLIFTDGQFHTRIRY